MQKFRSSFRLALLAAPLALVACANTDMAIPVGYTYDNLVYRAPKGPEAEPPAKIVDTNNMNASGTVGATLSPAEVQAINADIAIVDAQSYALVADDLITKLITNFGRPVEPVFVNETTPLTASLKASMTRHNIPVAAQPGDGPFVIEPQISGSSATIIFFSNHARVTSESGAVQVFPLVP